MFNWFWKKKHDPIEDEIKRSFSGVKKDMTSIGKWIKHLDEQDKQLFNLVSDVKQEMSTIKDDLDGFKEAFEMSQQGVEIKQVFEKTPVLSKRTSVLDVQEAVQTPVQTDNLYDIFKNLSGNERLIIFSLLNSEMKLSYEDLALMLGKERSTIRGQVNAIKQKAEGMIEEISEKSGKKRIYIPEEIKEKLSKYAKVRVNKNK